MSQGSASETDYHLLLARDLRYLSTDVADELTEEAQAIGRMLQGYRSKLQADQ